MKGLKIHPVRKICGKMSAQVLCLNSKTTEKAKTF